MQLLGVLVICTIPLECNRTPRGGKGGWRLHAEMSSSGVQAEQDKRGQGEKNIKSGCHNNPSYIPALPFLWEVASAWPQSSVGNGHSVAGWNIYSKSTIMNGLRFYLL